MYITYIYIYARLYDTAMAALEKDFGRTLLD